MIKIRCHKGALNESLETLVELENNKEKIKEYFIKNQISPREIKCILYDSYPDDRIDWKQTYIIMGRFIGDWSVELYPVAFSDCFFDFK